MMSNVIFHQSRKIMSFWVVSQNAPHILGLGYLSSPITVATLRGSLWNLSVKNWCCSGVLSRIVVDHRSIIMHHTSPHHKYQGFILKQEYNLRMIVISSFPATLIVTYLSTKTKKTCQTNILWVLFFPMLLVFSFVFWGSFVPGTAPTLTFCTLDRPSKIWIRSKSCRFSAWCRSALSRTRLRKVLPPRAHKPASWRSDQ